MPFKILFVICLCLGLATSGLAQMSSANYSIPSSVLAGGGGAMSSGNFQTISTAAQPSPLEVLGYTDSTNFYLYPGFWNTVAIVIPEACEGDFDEDGDVDGSDLATFAADFGRTDCGTGLPCEGDFDDDSDVDGSDLATFAADFGRTDCP